MKYIWLVVVLLGCTTTKKFHKAVSRGKVCEVEVDALGKKKVVQYYFIVRDDGYCEEVSSKRYYMNLQLPEVFTSNCKEAPADK